MRTRAAVLRPWWFVFLAIAVAGCSGSTVVPSPPPSGSAAPPSPSLPPTTPSTPAVWHFPSERFAGLGMAPVSDELAAELQAALEASAGPDGMTAALMTSQGTWTGATGMASAEREMVPSAVMSIASITKTITAAQVMQLIEAGKLGLKDLAADWLPAGLAFDTNGATIEDLLSMRSGISEYFLDEDEFMDAVTRDLQRVWTTEEKLATVDPKRGPVGQDREWEYIGTNYLLLGLIVQQVAGRPIAEVMRAGVLADPDFERIVFQPDERPTAPFALPGAVSDATFDDLGGFIPSLASVTLLTSEGNVASDSLTLARWFGALCAGRIVSTASLDDMTDLRKRPEYSLGIFDRRDEYGAASGALGHTGFVHEGGRTAALCFQDPGLVVVVMSNVEHDVETTAGNLVNVVFPGAAQ